MSPINSTSSNSSSGAGSSRSSLIANRYQNYVAAAGSSFNYAYGDGGSSRSSEYEQYSGDSNSEEASRWYGYGGPESATASSPMSSSTPYFIQDQNEWFVEGSHLWPILVTGYSLVFLVGVIGNVLLLFALYGSGGSRRARALPVRNHLMVNLAAADLFVTAVCVPISACAAASHACWPSFVVSWMCQLSPLLQKTPVAASTLSLALLSLDRWAAFRHPRFAQRFREKRFVIMSMISIWILASLVSAPTFWARQWETGLRKVADSMQASWAHGSFSAAVTPSSTDYHGDLNYYSNNHDHDYGYNSHYPPAPTPSTILHNSNTSNSNWYTNSQFNNSEESSSWGGICLERWTNLGLEIAYVATYLGTAFISPALIVAACHASVSQKLTSQLKGTPGGQSNLSAKHNKSDNFQHPGLNELVPIGGITNYRPKPKQVIIVAHDANNALIHGNMDGNVEAGNGPSIGPPTRSKIIQCDPNDDSDDENDEYLRLQIQADLESFRQISQQIKMNSTAANKVNTGKRKTSTSSLLKTLHPNSFLHPNSHSHSQSRSRSHSSASRQDLDLEAGLGIEDELPSCTPGRKISFIDGVSVTEHVVVERRRSSIGKIRRQSIPKLHSVFGAKKQQRSASIVSIDDLRKRSEDAEKDDNRINNNVIIIKPIRAAKNEASIIQSHRKFRKKLLDNEKRQTTMLTASMNSTAIVQPPSLMPTYSSQSFRSRRRAANLMAALAIVFVLCWVPYVICTIWDMCTHNKELVRLLLPFALFLGHAHSAINPVVSWRLNRSAFVRFQKKSFFQSLIPDWSCLRSCRLSCRSVASCRYYCCSFTGDSCWCCTPTYDIRNSSFGDAGVVVDTKLPALQTEAAGGGRVNIRQVQQKQWIGAKKGNLRNPHFNPKSGRRPSSLAAAISHNQRLNRRSTFCGRLKYHLCCQWCACYRCRCCDRGSSFSSSYGGGGGGSYQQRRGRRRRGSSPDRWNTSTNEAALGAFHPKYLSRLPAPDPISKCHTSHFLH